VRGNNLINGKNENESVPSIIALGDDGRRGECLYEKNAAWNPDLHPTLFKQHTGGNKFFSLVNI